MNTTPDYRNATQLFNVVAFHYDENKDKWNSLFALGLWTLVYNVLLALVQLSPETVKRIVSFGHAILITNLSLVAGCRGPNPFQDYGVESTELQRHIITLSLGYFIFDTVWCLYYNTEGPTMICHNFITMVALLSVLRKGTGGTEVVAGLFITEITNPFLQLRWLSRERGFRNTSIYKIADLTFIILFFICRIVVGSALCFRILAHSNTEIEVKISALSVFIVSLVFMYSISRYFFSKYVKNENVPAHRGSLLPSNPLASTPNETNTLASAPNETNTLPSAPSETSEAEGSVLHSILRTPSSPKKPRVRIDEVPVKYSMISLSQSEDVLGTSSATLGGSDDFSVTYSDTGSEDFPEASSSSPRGSIDLSATSSDILLGSKASNTSKKDQ